MDTADTIILDAAAVPVAPPKPIFTGAAARSKAFPLEWPIEYDGLVYDTIVIRRLTTDEVAAFLKSIEDLSGEDAKVTIPVFRDAQDRQIPDLVLGQLDDDDMTELNKAANDFLPRRFRAAPANDSTPSTGATTAP